MNPFIKVTLQSKDIRYINHNMIVYIEPNAAGSYLRLVDGTWLRVTDSAESILDKITFIDSVTS